VFARISTFSTADPSPHFEPELIHRLMVRVLEVLPKMDGYEGAYYFMDHKSGKAITISLWESEEAMQRTEEALRTLRKEVAEGLPGNIVDVEHFEVGENLVQEIHERELVEQELRVARTIQQASLPKEVPQNCKAGRSLPTTEPLGKGEATSTTSTLSLRVGWDSWWGTLQARAFPQRW
jgi:heme-degrading monooxygenase HmoA